MKNTTEILNELFGDPETGGPAADPEKVSSLREELFWAAVVRVMADPKPNGAVLRLFADIKGWTKSAGESALASPERISQEEARQMFSAFLASQGVESDEG